MNELFIMKLFDYHFLCCSIGETDNVNALLSLAAARTADAVELGGYVIATGIANACLLFSGNGY